MIFKILNLHFFFDYIIYQTKLNNDRIEKVIKMVLSQLDKDKVVKLSIDEEDLKDLIEIYRISCDILDPIELPTITGYSWKEAQEMLDKLVNVKKM